jgi:hypothetical protein
MGRTAVPFVTAQNELPRKPISRSSHSLGRLRQDFLCKTKRAAGMCT